MDGEPPSIRQNAQNDLSSEVMIVGVPTPGPFRWRNRCPCTFDGYKSPGKEKLVQLLVTDGGGGGGELGAHLCKTP